MWLKPWPVVVAVVVCGGDLAPLGTRMYGTAAGGTVGCMPVKTMVLGPKTAQSQNNAPERAEPSVPTELLLDS